MQLIDLECQKDLYALFRLNKYQDKMHYAVLHPRGTTFHSEESCVDVLAMCLDEDDEPHSEIVLVKDEGLTPSLRIRYLDECEDEDGCDEFELASDYHSYITAHHYIARLNQLHWVGKRTGSDTEPSSYYSFDLETKEIGAFKELFDPGEYITLLCVTRNALGELTYFAGKNAAGHFAISCLDESARKLTYLQEVDDLIPDFTPVAIKGLHAVGDTVCVTYEVVSVTNHGVQRWNHSVVIHQGAFKEFFAYPATPIYYAHYQHEDGVLWVFSPYGVFYLTKDPERRKSVKALEGQVISIYLPYIEDGVIKRIYRYPFTDKAFLTSSVLTPEELFS